MPIKARWAAFGACLGAVACSALPSRTPLGGSYVEQASAAAPDRRAATPAQGGAAGNEEKSAEAERATAKVSVTPVSAAAAPPPSIAKEPGIETLHYQALKTGDQVKGEVSLSFDADLTGGPPGMASKLSIDGRLRVEMKITRASAQSLDELELTVTTLSMHTEFAGRTHDSKQEPPDVYDVTLSGRSPSIRPRNGSKPDDGDRAVLLILVAPLAEFHSHWAASPTLELKPGWSSKVDVKVPAFAGSGGDTVHVGPLQVSYSGRDTKTDNVPFDLKLPIQYSADMGKLDFELAGKTTLNAASARPSSLELSGRFTARGGASGGGAEMSFSGSTKFSAQLSYH